MLFVLKIKGIFGKKNPTQKSVFFKKKFSLKELKGVIFFIYSIYNLIYDVWIITVEYNLWTE